MRHLSCIAVVCVGAIHAAAVPGAVSGAENDNIIESFEIQGNGDWLVVPVTVAGRECKFLIDTGCTISVVDSSLRQFLKPTGKFARMNAEETRTEFYRWTGLVGNRKLASHGEVICWDLASFFDGDSRNEIRGMLGMDFLRSKVLRIDFDARRLSILRTAANSPGKRFDLKFDEGECPTLKLTLPVVGETSFGIDTGHRTLGNGQLSHRVFDDLRRANALSSIEECARTTISGSQPSRRGKVIGSVSLAGFDHSGQFFGEGGVESKLGLGYLCRYRVTFDFPNRALFLEPGRQFERRFPANRLRMELIKNDSRLLVTHAAPDGLGYECGLRDGDEILAVDGRAARQMTTHSAHELLDDPAEGTVLEVRRPDGVVRHAKLSPKRFAGSSAPP